MSEALFDLDEAPAEVDQLRLLVHFRTDAGRIALSHLLGHRINVSTQALSYPISYKIQPENNAVQQVEQPALFDVVQDWINAWRGMPAYVNTDLMPCQTVAVAFPDQASRRAFATLLCHPITDETQFIWFPREKIDEVNSIRWRSTRSLNTRYPVYVPTKGRWDSAHTIKCMERLGIPYFAVVQPQECKHYESVVKTGTMLLLPDGLDGLVPTRNWIFEHAIASGAERHWQLDDNIRAFYRRHENRHIRTADATSLCVLEDFVDRYENIAVAGFSYEMFVTRRNGDYPPFIFNTRIYSNSLINNRIPFRYRDVYNDDTDICLRALKAGWCTVQFNAFLAQKLATMIVKGGNTPIYLGAEAVAAEWEAHTRLCKACTIDISPTCEAGRAILQRDGRWQMAESLYRQHPDVTTIGRRWNRWQHYVDYRQFKRNEPIYRPGFVMPEGQDDYGLELVELADAELLEALTEGAKGEDIAPHTKAVKATPVKSGPSAFDFLAAMASQPNKPNPVSESPTLASLQPESRAETGQSTEPAPDLNEPDDQSNAVTFASDLKARSHRLLTRDGKFFVSNASQLTDDDRAAIKQHRAALVGMAEEWIEPHESRSPDGERATEQTLGDRPASIAESTAKAEPGCGRIEHSVITTKGGVKHEVTVFVQEGDEPANAGSIPADSLFTSNPSVSLAQFLGSEQRQVESDWCPDEPPDLTGIDEVILNFATTGLNWLGGDRPCGVTVSTFDRQMTRFLPFAFAGGNLDESTIKRWAQEQLRNKKITNSKTKFDIHMSREWGIDLEEQGCTFSDIQHTAALLDDHRKKFSLDILAAHYFPGEQFALRLDETQHHRFAASQVAERERETARLVGRLHAVMYPEIEAQDLRRVQDLEDGVILAVVEMEKNGSPIDMDLLEQYGFECNKKHDELMWEVSRECGFAFEHTASGWKRLIESLHLTVPDSFSESILNEVDHPLIRKGQRAAQYASLNSKIFKAYPEHIVNGILRYNINQLASDDGGTVSGRFSIGIVQQVPNAYNHEATFGDELFPRRLFIPGNGDYFEGDAEQIEFRLLVHYSENAKLLQAYRDDPRMSFHKKMQEMLVVHKPNMNYAHTKSYNFAAQYGAKSIKLAVMMGFINEREGDEIRRAKRWDDPRLKTIKEIEAAYKQAHPEATALLDRASHLAKTECDEFCKHSDALHRKYSHRGYVKTFLGRRSRFPTNYKTYIGLNRVLQGTGADVMKKKLTEVHAQRKETGFIMRITNHDAVLGDATTPETSGKVSEILNQQSFPFKVPILWQCGTGQTWADCK